MGNRPRRFNRGAPSALQASFEEVLRTVAHSFEASPDFERGYYGRWVPYFQGCRAVLDVACGQGVLLELLRAEGIPAEGIDIDPQRVAEARSKGLQVTQATAQEHLSSYPGRYDGIFLGHIVEHFPGEQMLRLLYDCRQALSPRGVMVVLTPNFQNPQVALMNFWLDVTHHRPFPLPLLDKIFDALGLQVIEQGFAANDLDAYVIGQVAQNVRTSDQEDGWLPVRQPQAAVAETRPAPAPRRTQPPELAGQRATGRLSVVWEGSFFETHSLALVNRELALAALASGELDLSVRLRMLEPITFDPRAEVRLAPLLASVDRQLDSEPVVHIRHAWPPVFDRPASGKWVMVQPWEYGALPTEWVAPMRNVVDEIWAYSNAVRQVYIDSGVPPEKVFVVPLGVDANRFNPTAAPLPLPTTKRFRFLFVGGTIWRKGIDPLLEAYCRAFRKADDVCLIIKDMGQDSYYKGQGAAEAIARLQADPDAPEIVYLTDPIADEGMPGLYTACHCLAHPYRGEGFGLPVAEAMACGLAVIVTKGGSTDDFCAEDRALLVPATRHPINIGKPTAGQAWVLEVDVEALAAQMRAAYEEPDKAAQVGHRASEWVLHNLTWEVAAGKAMERLRALASAEPATRATGLPWPLATQRPRRLLAWPKWESAQDLQALLTSIREVRLLDDPELCLCLRLDPERDPPPDQALAALQSAAATTLPEHADIQVLVVDDPMPEEAWSSLGAAVQAGIAIGSGKADRRKQRFFRSLGRPVLRNGAELASFLGDWLHSGPSVDCKVS